MKTYLSCLLLALLPIVTRAGQTIPLSQLDLALIDDVRIGTITSPPPSRPKLSRAGFPISIAGRAFEDGFGLRGVGRWQLALDGKAERLHAWIGMTDDSMEPGPVWFEVIGDGRLLYQSDPLKLGEAAREVSVPLDGVKSLALVVQSPDGMETFTAWADASIAYAGAAPKAVSLPAERPYILTPPVPVTPRINSAKIFGARPGNPFFFAVAATGERPMTFVADRLPKGLHLDASTGRITGSVAERGEYRVTLTAKNARGSTTGDLRIVIGDLIALTPPMGWNDWNCFGPKVTEQNVRTAADALVKAGLPQHGWTYINIDEFWTNRPLPDDPIYLDIAARAKAKNIRRPVYATVGADGHIVGPPAPDDPTLIGPIRDSQGRINCNSRFPDMQGLVDHVHNLGLKIGLYSSPGPVGCGRCAGSYGHEVQDAQRVAAWGFDYFKYDWCSYRYYIADDSRAELMKPYKIMGDALRAQKRDIVFSLCQYGMGNVGEWGAEVGGNLWRTTYDITDSWTGMSGIGFSHHSPGSYVGPGHWNDLDIFVLGRIGWGGKQQPTQLTPDEQYTHFSLWCLAASPLLIGCDLTQLDDFTLSLLANDEVIAINQDPLGQPAHRVSRDRNLEVWARPLEDGSMAVGLFNRGELPAEITARWSDLKLSGEQRVRDLWRQQDLGTHTGTFSAQVPRHGVVLVKVSPVKK